MADSEVEQLQKAVAIVDNDGHLQVATGKQPASKLYDYSPLPSKGSHLRLVRLHPGVFDSPIHVDIEIHELEFTMDKPDYWALSYTWSDPEHDNLVINGARISPYDDIRSKHDIRHLISCGSQEIMISTNLRDALRRLRNKEAALILWIDQLCINQNDMDERATQVVTMQRIYHMARGVRIWLGEHRDESKLGIDLAIQLQQLGNDVLAGQRQQPSYNDLYQTTRFGLPHFPDAPEWAAFMKLLARPVFRRIWILQEIVSATHAEVICGDSPAFHYDVFVNAIGFLQAIGWDHRLTDSLDEGKNNISFFVTVGAVESLWLQTPSLELRTKQRHTLLRRTRRFQASDPRDKIFALLPLINDYGHRELYGVDAPIEFQSSRDYKRPEGPLDRLFDSMIKLEDEEEATAILRNTFSSYLEKLRTPLLNFLRFAPKILEPFLQPAPGHTLERLQQEAMIVLDALKKSIAEIRMRRSDTREHKIVLVFLDNFFKDVFLRLQTFCNLLKTPVELRMQLVGDREYIDDIKVLLKSIELTQSRLLHEPADTAAPKHGKGPSFGELKAQGKVVIGEPIGRNLPPKKQFHDWAWSVLGSTVADYRKDVKEVFIEFTVKCLQDDKNLAILSHIEDASERRTPGLPSWVPDFGAIMLRNFLPATLNQEDQSIVNYRTCGDLHADMVWNCENPGQLDLEGHFVGKINWLASHEKSSNTGTVTFQNTLDWEEAISNLPKTYHNGQDTFDAYWRTLIGDTIGSSNTFPAPQDWANVYHSFISLLEVESACQTHGGAGGEEVMSKRGITTQNFDSYLQESDTFIQEMAGVMLQRKLCVLEEGSIGVVPLSARIGDDVWVLKGGSVPFVLRLDEGDKYMMLGECYVHGIMRGEQVERFAWKKVQLA